MEKGYTEKSGSADHIHDFAQELRKEKEELAKLMTKEMGRPIKEARAEVEKCAWVMDYFADNSKVFLNDEVINTDARKSVVAFEPLGVIGSPNVSVYSIL